MWNFISVFLKYRNLKNFNGIFLTFKFHAAFTFLALKINKFCMCMLSCFSHVQLFVTLWTVACQAPLPKEFSRQEYWSEKKKKRVLECCHALLRGIFLTQRSTVCFLQLLHCRQILSHWATMEAPCILNIIDRSQNLYCWYIKIYLYYTVLAKPIHNKEYT